MPPPDAAFLSELKVLAAYLIFAGSYFVFALGKFAWMKIEGVAVSFGKYARIGLPVTFATIVAGSLWLWATM